MKTADFELGVVSELFSAGRNEDGEEVLGHIYSVLAEDKTGRRFSHIDYVKDTVRKKCDPDESDCGSYWCLVLDAEQQVENKKKSLLLSENMILTDWLEVEPRYGSEAYCQKNQQNTLRTFSL